MIFRVCISPLFIAFIILQSLLIPDPVKNILIHESGVQELESGLSTGPVYRAQSVGYGTAEEARINEEAGFLESSGSGLTSESITMRDAGFAGEYGIRGKIDLPLSGTACRTTARISGSAFKGGADAGPDAPFDDVISNAPEALLSPSAKFLIRYHLTGPHAVFPADSNASGVPDFVEMAAIYADSAWNYLIGQFGFADPVPGENPYEIILESRGSSIFGETVINPGGQTTRSYVHPTFEGFPENVDPEGSRSGALKVTVAHELKHASQFAGTGWQGDAGHMHWMELDAIAAENLVFPDVKDYYRHLNSMNSIFRDPRISVPVNPWQVTWMMYWAERFGPEFMAGVWENLALGYSMVESIRMGLAEAVPVHAGPALALPGDAVLSGHGPLTSGVNSGTLNKTGPFDAGRYTGGSFAAGLYDDGEGEPGSGTAVFGWQSELARNYLWHMASGAWASDTEGFSDRHNFPTPSPSVITNHLQRINSPQFTYLPLSAGFHKMVPAGADTGDVVVFAVGTDSAAALGLYGYRNAGGGVKRVYTPDSFGRILQNSGLRWEEVDTLALVTVNAAAAGNRSIALLAGSGPSIERLLYGDATGNGVLNHSDVALILASLVGNTGPLTGFSGFVSDVTGNGRVSAYDASLILQKLSGHEGPFPADVNGNGYGPEYDLINTGGNSPFAGLRGNSGELLSGLHFRLQAEETSEQLESGLEVIVENAGNDGFYSVLIEMLVPANYLEVLSGIQLEGPLSGGRSALNVSGDTVRVAIASTEMVTDGRIAVIPVYAWLEGNPEITIRSVKVDEFTARGITTEGTGVVINKRPAVGVDPVDELPRRLALRQNYPNPFNPTTMLRFDLPESGQISLKLYDINGRLAGTLASGFREAGRYELPLNSETMGLSSGTYLLVLEQNGIRDVIKLGLVK